jgi:hypothetical protein
MLDRKEVLFLKSWGSVRSGGRPSKNLGDIQTEYMKRVQEDAKKIQLIKAQKKVKT